MVKVIGHFNIDGKGVLLRYPKAYEYGEFQRFINKGVEESLEGGGYLARTTKVSLKSEREWVKKLIENIKNKKEVHIVADYNGRIIGNTGIRKDSHDATSHIGLFGIVILKEFTSKGLGTVLTDKIIKLAKKELKTEIIKLSVFGNNKRAQGLYRKMGFKEIGRIKKGRKVEGKYSDEILMVKYL